MGVIQSACPNRRSPAAQPVSLKKAEAEVPVRSPTRSTKQFEGGSLSRSAEGFTPPGLGPSPKAHLTSKQQARAKQASTAPRQPAAVNPNDPSWAQYLEQKVAERSGPHQAEQKPNPRGNKADQKGASTATPGNFVLQTSDYLKLLKEGDQKKGAEKNKNLVKPDDKLFSKDASMTGLKNDLVAALDSIIKTQQSSPGQKKPKANTGAGGLDALSQIAQMMSKDNAEDNNEPETSLQVHDDIFCERQNRDEDLAIQCYWSDDDQAPRAIKRASAHHATGKVAGVRPRSYVTQKLDDNLDHQVAILLRHLRRLSDRQRSIEPAASAKRRLIVGLKEVARAVRQGKVKCVVVAPDIEDVSPSGAGVEGKIREIVSICYQQDVPVIFTLSRSRIGWALGKSLRMSALAIVDVTGTNALYESILEESYAQRVAWLAKQPKPMAPWKAKAAAKAANKA